MSEPIRLEELLARSEKAVALPLLSKEAGTERTIRVRRIGRAEYLALLPPAPPGAETWRRDEFTARELAWLQTLSPEQLEARRAALRDVLYRVVATVSLDPPLTLDHARRLGPDGEVVAMEVVRWSGLLGEPATDATPALEAVGAA
jgi:hypothetical protein